MEPRGEPAPFFVCEEGADDFLDFHVGSMIVGREGTPYFSNSDRIWRLASDQDSRLVVFAGSREKGHLDGPPDQARFDRPYGMVMDAEGNLLVAELSGRLRRVDPEGVVTTVAGGRERGYLDGPANEARFDQCFGVASVPDGRLYVAEYAPGMEYRIRVVLQGEVRTLARIPTDGAFRR